ncbi:MAG: ABC transporter permease, partial [Candidatus Eremiobacteraeota bacterium]|nr:ABC transporter permease [Candidatus Eremiobacteraeota bacterium]
MPLALRHAWRALLARPALTLGILITLSLGIGANAAMLGALDALLFRAPTDVVDPGQIARVYIDQRVGVPGGGISAITNYPFFAALRRQTDAFAGAAAVIAMTELSVGSGATAERVPGRAVSANYFALLGARPALGRFFTPADDRPDAAPEV